MSPGLQKESRALQYCSGHKNCFMPDSEIKRALTLEIRVGREINHVSLRFYL